MATTQTKTQTKTQNKASANTPVSKAQTAAVEKAQTKAVEKAQTKAVEKAQTQSSKSKGVFGLVAGTIVSIEHKALRKAIGYHVSKGNLERTPNGLKLTKQGADDWHKNRVLVNPEGFQKIATFVNGGANLPEFGGEKKTPVKIGSNKQLPSLEFWGSFATMNMRLCFASLWASK